MVVSGRCEMSAAPSGEAWRQLRLRYRLGAVTADTYTRSCQTLLPAHDRRVELRIVCMVGAMTMIDWNGQLLEQLTLHWDHHVRPRLEGLTDAEYFWEPAPNCWSIGPRADATTAMAAGVGDYVADFAVPEPTPPPVTTIAWRLGHVIVGVFGMRNASHFGGPKVDYTTAQWAPDATTALAQLDDGYRRWVEGVRSLGEDSLAEPVGPAEGPFAAASYSTLVLHINREAIHHLAEVLTLRDLYRSKS